jgi:hypothetical protein
MLGTPDRGVMQMRWAGDGRYAVVEYVSTGADATTSVIAWDSVTRRTVQAVGFRLVSVEPSSTQIWLTRAVAREAVPPQDGTDFAYEDGEPSPWKDPVTADMPPYDGPGTPWVWDATRGGAPMRPAENAWRSWSGAAGITAVMAVVPDNGLWPESVSFTSEGTAPVMWRPKDELTFTPLGWSPSGRYFAVRQAADFDVGRVSILDARTGRQVAEVVDPSNFTSDGEDGPPPTAYGGISGAAWDAESDSLLVLRYDTQDDGNTYRVQVTTLSPDSSPRTLEGAPAEWKTSSNEPTLLGRDGRGVLISVEGESGTKLWRIAAGRIVSAGTFDTRKASLDGAGAYSANGKLLVYASPDNGSSFSRFDADAAVSDLTGQDITAFWPPK